MSASFEEAYVKAVKSGLLPGAVLLAESADGSFQYRKCFGGTTADPKSSRPVTEKDVFAIASCTKLMTDVAVLQCVERGLLELDADVQITVPEITKYGIITGWDEEKNVAILSPARNKITMRHLITGSSGHCYEVIHPLLTKWRLSRNEAFFGGDTIEEKCTIPLVFEPGTAWAYGGGWDWAGKIVEKVTHKTLEEYMRENIWEPLGLKDCTFWPEKRSDFKDRRVRMSVLDRKSQKSFPGEFDLTGAAKDCTGGGGVYATPEDYLQFLLAVLRQDERLVKRASFAEMFRPQLSETAAGAFKAMFDHVPEAQGYYACNVPAGTPKDYSLGGLFVKEDVPGWMKKETILWSGLPCLLWFIDSETGLCGIASSQVIPPLAPPIHALHEKFMKGVYKLFAARSGTKI